MDYPATLDVDAAPAIARWRPLFQWVLAIPHFVVLYGLGIATEVVAIIAWFAILFTGRMPEGMARFICMTQRYQTRVATYAAGLHDQYPPFEFGNTTSDPGGSPARVNFRPALGGRNRLTVGLRFLWIIPAAIVTFLIGIVAMVCWLIGAFAVLFTGRWPEGMRAWVMKGLRAGLRLGAYQWLLTDEYPPMNFA
jgi:hypothetical protein